jgi:acetoin:2,6-dichlorophenolindophenol oxidoreductase subunit alpha
MRGGSVTCFTDAQRREAFRRMLSIRRFEEEGERLLKAGKVPGTLHTSIGQEAAIVGPCMALRDDDMMTGTHRSHGHPIAKGARLAPLMAELLGKATGICKGRGGSMHLADNSVGIMGESAIVGGGIPLATGCGLAAKVRGTDQVAMCFFGDGAVNNGTFHESLNMASLWKLPVIYLCENNRFAVTTSLAASHAQVSVAKRGEAYAMPSVAVDGQDVRAVYAAAREAVARARCGDGPTLIEALTYRFDEHSANMGSLIKRTPYRSPEEVADYKANRDPIKLFRQVLFSDGCDRQQLAALENAVEEEVVEAVRFAEESPWPDRTTLYDYMFSQPIAYPSTVSVAKP